MNEVRHYSGDIRDGGGCLSDAAAVDDAAAMLSSRVWYAACTISLCCKHQRPRTYTWLNIRQIHTKMTSFFSSDVFTGETAIKHLFVQNKIKADRPLTRDTVSAP